MIKISSKSILIIFCVVLMCACSGKSSDPCSYSHFSSSVYVVHDLLRVDVNFSDPSVLIDRESGYQYIYLTRDNNGIYRVPLICHSSSKAGGFGKRKGFRPILNFIGKNSDYFYSSPEIVEENVLLLRGLEDGDDQWRLFECGYDLSSGIKLPDLDSIRLLTEDERKTILPVIDDANKDFLDSRSN